MRKIFIILMLLPCFSCTDWLNVESEKSVTYLNYFKSESDLEKVLISIFGYEKALYAPANPEAFGYVGLLCDDAGARKGYKELNVLDFYSNQYMEGWSRYYSLIYLVHMLEETRYRFENISEERTDYWIAQANFAKALAYFTLAQKWGEAPMAPSTESIDVVGKSSVEDILQEAIRCAEIALSLPTHENLTDANGEAVTSKQYASLGSVHTLLANIYAWMGGLYGETSYWEKAESHASQVIDGKVGFYKLEGDIKSVVNNTLGGNRKSDETIFTIEVNSQDDNKYSSAWFSAIYPGQSLIDYPYDHASPEALETNTDKPRILVNTVYNIFLEEKDQRRKEYWKELGEASYEGSTWEEDPETGDWVEVPVTIISEYAFLNKWQEPIVSSNPDIIGEEGRIPLLGMEGNRVIWRLADLILLRAECRARLGMATAVDDLDQIRIRAGLERYDESTNLETLRREIFRERERELFGEGQRYYDAVRNGYLKELSDEYGALTDTDIKNGALYLPVNSNTLLKKNPLMTQNTYWLWRE